MQCWLAPDVHAAAIGEDIVFLDVATDAYFCLARGGQTLTLAGGGLVRAANAQAVAPLIEAGLLSRAAARGARQSVVPPSQGLAGRPGRPGPTAALRALRANRAAARAVAGLAFKALIGLADQAGSGLEPAREAEPALLDDARDFSLMAPWLPHGGVCLMRSLQQLLYLRALGHRPRWVFGVRTWPFDAHCWLQAGDVVLDDHLEHVQAYTPILAV